MVDGEYRIVFATKRARRKLRVTVPVPLRRFVWERPSYAASAVGAVGVTVSAVLDPNGAALPAFSTALALVGGGAVVATVPTLLARSQRLYGRMTARLGVARRGRQMVDWCLRLSADLLTFLWYLANSLAVLSKGLYAVVVLAFVFAKDNADSSFEERSADANRTRPANRHSTGRGSGSPKTRRVQCSYRVPNGERCKRTALPGSDSCGRKHDRCTEWVYDKGGTRHPCPNIALETATVCGTHDKNPETYAAAAARTGKSKYAVKRDYLAYRRFRWFD